MTENARSIPNGFAPLTDPEADVPELTILEAERWLDGAVVTYRGLREWKSSRGETHHAHAVESFGETGATVYGVWSTAVLDRLFRQVSIGEKVYLRYEGLGPHPKVADRSVHNWTVARAAPTGVTPSRL